MSNGTIRSQLYKVDHRKLALTFKIRKHIALGVAKALVYLHEKCSPKIVHHNVNSGTILLDDEYEALVPDFEFCKVIDSMPTRIVQGIIGYIAPEYYSNGVVSVKNDVYSYGVLLMELITARDPRWGVKDCSEHEGVVNLVDWVKKLAKDNKVESIVDSNFKEYNVIDIKNLLQVALSCIQSSPSARPKMSEVVSMLQRNNLD